MRGDKIPLEERIHAQNSRIDKAFYSVGIDGCRGGWIAAVICGGELSLYKFGSLMEITDELPFDVCLIDMAIGLQGSERQIRSDSMARKILKKKSPAVFTVPCRKAVYGETKEKRL